LYVLPVDFALVSVGFVCTSSWFCFSVSGRCMYFHFILL